ncbi:diacylglycerol kinase family protein, partial [Candidatus Kuenenbacteria bacterium]|nr:diacylglycerol kinase family protein [Candidatus Kuenenbacteria bacterium]
MKLSCQKLKQSLKNAFWGLKIALGQHSFLLMILITLLVLFLAWFLKISFLEWLIVILLIGLILSLEVFNTVLEKLLDFIEPNHSPRVKEIKDLIAAAVLVICLISLVLGLIIFLP